MLDQELKEQLQGVFAQLENKIEFVYQNCEHEDQNSLLELLGEITATSSHLSLRSESLLAASVSEPSPAQSSQAGSTPVPSSASTPRFRIDRAGQPTGMAFTGIPTGHEFTSLILAILNADGKGKFPDDSIQARIRHLRGPVRLKTYISLTCENCPDVVQALNLMALIHPDFQHEMVDGQYVQKEIDALGIQGVPSIVSDSTKLIHSGRISFADLLTKLEETLGVDESAAAHREMDLGDFDVAVIGGGPAGASAAIYSVRKGLKTVLLAEKFGGQVQDTKGIENMISVPYTEGVRLTAQLNEHIASYPVKVLEHRRVDRIETLEASRGDGASGENVIHIQGGERLKARQIIIATGAKWRELGVPGEKEYIGRGVAFCAHCDGPYYKGKKVAVVGGGNSGVEAAIDLASLVHEVVLFEYNDKLKADEVLVEKLKTIPNASIVLNARTKEVVGDGQKVVALVYEDRKSGQEQRLETDGVFVQIGLLPNSQFVKGTVETNSYGEILVDAKGRTSAPGIYAAGDVTTVPFKQIVIAMGEGAKVALAAFEDRMYASASAAHFKPDQNAAVIL